MRFRVTLPCPNCGKTIEVEAVGAERFPDAKCQVCGATIYSADNSTVGLRVLSRAQQEIEDRDFTLSIILSAMAVECQLAFLFFKWKRVDLHMADTSVEVQVSEEQEQEWADEYRGWNTIGRKLDNFSQLMANSDLDSFVSGSATLSKLVAVRHPDLNSTSAKKFFVEHLFRRRNEILHSGKVDFDKSDAVQCLEQARTLFAIIAAMDRTRYDRVFPPQQHTSSI